MKIEIDGTDETDRLESGSLSIDKKYSDNSISRLTLITDGAYEPLIGEPVDIYDEESRHVFGGEIDDTRQYTKHTSGDKIFYDVNLVGWEDITNRRVINKDYTDELAGDIIRDIHSEKLAAENITLGKVNDGIVIDGTLRFSYQQISQALDKITEFSGLRWRITPDKTLEAISLDDFSSIRTLDDATRDIEVSKNRDEYRNRQIVIGGEQDFDNVESEDLPLVTETVEYRENSGYIEVDHPVDKLVEIDPGEIYGPVRIKVRFQGFEGNLWWSFEKGEKWIKHNYLGTPGPDDGEEITVTYRAQTNTTAISDDPNKQGLAKETEQGTGIHTDVIRADGIIGEEQTKQFAQKLLDIYGEYETEITFSDTALYQVGDRLQINITDFNVDSQYVTVERVEIQDERKTSGNLLRNITATTMPDPGGWEDFFKNVMASEGDETADQSGGVQYSPGSSGVGSIGTSQSWGDGEVESTYSQGRFVFIADGNTIQRYGLTGEKLGQLQELDVAIPTSVTVGSNSLWFWDSNEVVRLDDPINDETDYQEEATYTIESVSSPNTISYSKKLSSKVDNPVLWWYTGGKTVDAVDLVNDKIITTADISENNGYPNSYESDDNIFGVSEAGGNLYFPVHNNFDFSWNIFKADLSGRFIENIGIGRDEELSGGFAATSNSFYVREDVPDRVYYCDENGKNKRSIASIDAKGIGVGAI